ncbi:winged helix-turn-helix transcriptional regulator [Desulfuromonas thiophila]|uniref:Transcriptional regulator, HxlR family n=1 Tax=Desulfuromonas thiophila TaxID=57664 RepID=A0A1G7B4U9_9BACT|nr:helix-turn-helix domain-containing protein [Desulfuromonas thiophila]SDE22119.1 transcriptional regulator, HxlR family [Desulfuromonas thiophila]
MSETASEFEMVYRCGVTVTLEVIGGKWKGLILWHLRLKTLRFSQLQRRLAGVTQKMLTQQLRELEAQGLIHRQVYAEVPPRVEYSLTELGRSIIPILEQMCHWGQAYDHAQTGH